jgi:integrase
MIREWWTAEVQARRVTAKTGRNYLDSLAGVLRYARDDLGLINHDPVSEFRSIIRRKARTKEGRAASDCGRNIHPIENAAALHRLVEAARKRGAETHLFVLCGLDGGLRVGEILGLSWDRVGWGADDNDTSRHLLIDRSRPQGGKLEGTKSGRERKVAMSRRLQRELREFYMSCGRPDASTLILAGVDPANFRKREWVPVMAGAGLTGHTPKDLRDSFASHLLTAGIPLGYISRQLGHADTAVTARHYARWVGDEYERPPQLEEGDVPADLLARISEESHEAEKSRRAEG